MHPLSYAISGLVLPGKESAGEKASPGRMIIGKNKTEEIFHG
jgi:hypothetical protein